MTIRPLSTLFLTLVIVPVRADETVTAREPVLPAVRELAESTTVSVASADPPRAAKLREAPLLVYGDQTREISASSLWVWMDGDSPAMLQKIEMYDREPTVPSWVHCYSSLCTEELRVDWKAREGCRVQGVRYLDVSEAEAPSDNRKLRELQIRSIARQLSVHTDDGEKRALRLLPKPLLEFQDERHGVVTGAIFGYAFGTNPDVCLIVRAVKDESQLLRWQVAPIKMTSAAIVVMSASGQEIWTEPDNPHAGDYGHWGFFAVPRQDPRQDPRQEKDQ